MKTSDAGRDFIKRHEGLRLRPYVCPAGRLTVGYGHTGAGAREGVDISESEADALFDADMDEVERSLQRIVLGLGLVQHEYDALASFAFNLGAGRLLASTLLIKLERGDKAGAADEFLRWVKARGATGERRTLPGLVKRREEERAMFLGKGGKQ